MLRQVHPLAPASPCATDSRKMPLWPAFRPCMPPRDPASRTPLRAKDGGLLIFSDPFAPAPPTLSGIRRDASGVIRLTLKGSAGSPFTLERSTNLLRWENWIEGTLQETDAAGRELLDDSTILKAHQFYRARSE